jgi:hypothetical protein
MHDLVVRDLEQTRNRTLGLTDLDDPTLVTQHDPLMSPLVWDLAHVGQQRSCGCCGSATQPPGRAGPVLTPGSGSPCRRRSGCPR